MASINTNASAMTALQSLNMTNKRMEATQNAISTGFRVSSAMDNAAYWSIATTMRSDNKALSTVQDALGLGAATVDVAYTALDSAIDVTDEIKKKLVAAREPGIDREKVQSEISELQNQLQSIAESSSFSGENWVSVDSSDAGYNATKSIVSSFNRSGSGVSISTISIDISATELYDANDQSGIVDRDRTLATTGTIVPEVWTLTPADLEATETLSITIGSDTFNEAFDTDVATTLANFVTNNGSAITTLTGGVLASTATELTITNSAGDDLTGGTIAGVVTGGDAGTVAVVESDGTPGVSTFFKLSTLDISALTDSDADLTTLETYISGVDTAISEMTTAATNLGAVQSRVDMQKDFVSNLMDAIDRGIGQLVDADMTEESTKLQALQVQQQLGIQALSIANGNSQNILALFR